MNWPWSKRRAPSDSLMEALDSINRSHEDLFAAQKLTREAREVGDVLRESRRVNHFGAALEQTMRRTA